MAFFLFCFWFLIFVIRSQSSLVIRCVPAKSSHACRFGSKSTHKVYFFFLCLLSFGVSLMVDLEVCL